MYIDIPEALGALGQIVDRIAEMIEWEKLARQERRPCVPPSFQLADHFGEEMDSLCSSFISLDIDIHEALDRPDLDCSPEQRRGWRRQLLHLEKQAGELQNTAKLL